MTSDPHSGEIGEHSGAGLVAGRFRLGELLGSGGTASVFAAVDAVTGRRLAVKLLHPHLSESATVRTAFLDEARRAAQVSHPCIVVIVDIGVFEEAGVPIAWIAQERVEGVTLTEHVRAQGALAASDAASVGSDVLAALGAAHAQGLIHRDVSPANVMVRRDADRVLRATLLDFGLADAAGRTAHGDDVLRSAVSAETVGVVGNPQYASPEQLSGRPVSARGDLYQVGGLLFFALTGRAPFDGRDRLAVVRAHLSAPPPVPSVGRVGIPPALDRVVVRALLKDAEDRFADADEMRSALLAAVRVSAAPVGPAATRVLRPVQPTPATHPQPRSVPAPEPERAPDRSGGGWVVAVGVVAVLIVAATAIPLIAGTGRSVPVAEAATSPPLTTSATSAAPSATAGPTPTPIPSTTVPSVTTLADARAVIEAAALQVGEIVERDAASVAGTVLESQPAAGSSVPRGTAVRLVVASGSNTVPDVSGMDAANATSQLRRAGFTTTSVSVVSERPIGLIVALEPAAGSSVRLGDEVRLLISAAPSPAPTGTTPAPTPIATATPTPTPSTTAP